MFAGALGVLLSPLNYLRIKGARKWVFDWLWPAVLTVFSLVVIALWAKPGAVAGNSGLLDKLALVCSVLPGFYIAALAAIATFNRSDIDEMMPPPALTLEVSIRGHSNELGLTRRRFLALLFAFLCLESLGLLIVCVFASVGAAGVMAAVSKDFASLVKYGFLSLLLLMFWQMVSATCLGLYYLGDRLNRPAY